MAPEVMWGEKEMDHWILFMSVNELIIDGSGQIDGQGHAWWPCRKQSQVRTSTFVLFGFFQNLPTN